MIAASAWYDSAPLWGAAGLAGVLIVGFATVFVTYRVGATKRQLTYSMIEDTKLLGGVGSTTASDLKVLFSDQPVRNPHVVRVRLASRGRKDIRSEDFDQSRPLVLDVGADIVAQISAQSAPEPLPKLIVDGTSIKLGPDLIRKRQTVTITVLTDGASSHLTLNSPLIDVGVRRQIYRKGNRMIYLIVGAATSTLGLIGFIISVLTGGKSIRVTFPAITEIGLLIGLLSLPISAFFLGLAVHSIITERSPSES